MASSAPLYRYDVFISYSHADRTWVQTWLLPQVEAVGLRACIDDRDFAIGAPSIVNMEDAVIQSRHTLIVLTPAWVTSQWTAFEALLTQTTDPAVTYRAILALPQRLCCDHIWASTRLRKRSNFARPYILRLINFRRWICASTGPLLHGSWRALRTAA